MKRRKTNVLKGLYKHFYLPLIIIGILFVVYTGKITIEFIARAENFQKLVDVDRGKDDVRDPIGDGGNTESKVLGEEITLELDGEVPGADIQVNDVDEEKDDGRDLIGDGDNTESKELGEEITLELDGEVPDADTQVNDVDEGNKEDVIELVIPPLEQLVGNRENVNIGNNNASWNYLHDDGGGTLRLIRQGIFLLQNRSEGAVPNRVLPIHIIVEGGATGATMVLNNINISRPLRINSSNNFLGVNSENNAPVVTFARNVTLVLADESTNRIDGRDPLAGIASQRSAIYKYGSTVGEDYTLNINGPGSLICNDAGINVDTVPNSTGRIIIDSGDIEVNIFGEIRCGIGRAATDTRGGNVDIGIRGGAIRANLVDIVEENEVREIMVRGAVIGTGYTMTPVGSLEIRISGTAQVDANMFIHNLNPTSRNNIIVQSAIIGGGGSTILAGSGFFIIEISGSPTVNANLDLKGGERIGHVSMHGAAIGEGILGRHANGAVINISGGKVNTKQIAEIRKTDDVLSGIELNGAGIGSGMTAIHVGPDYNFSINVSGGEVSIEQSLYVIGDGSEVGNIEVYHRGAGLGLGYMNIFNIADINIVGGVSITVGSNSYSVSPNVTIESYGAAIGAASRGDGLSRSSIININISGAANVIAHGGFTGIGGTDNGPEEVNISIKELRGVVPSIVATARNSMYGLYSGSSGSSTIDPVRTFIDLGVSRNDMEPLWDNWNDYVEKVLRIESDSSGEFLRTITIPARVQGVMYTIPSLGSRGVIDTNVYVDFFSGENAVRGYFVHRTSLSNIIPVANNMSITPVGFMYTSSLPALRVLYEGSRDREGNNWSYVHNETGGTLRLTGSDEFVLKNLERGGVDETSVPIHIVIEDDAAGSNIIFNNINIKRAGLAESDIAILDVDGEAIAPVIIKADLTKIILAEGSKNTIDGQDTLLETGGYRAAIYLYAGSRSEYTLNLERENISATTEPPKLTTLNGGINALGVSGSTVNMNITSGDYNLSAIGAKSRYGAGLGSGYVTDNQLNMTYNFDLAGPTVEAVQPLNLRVLGESVAIGSNIGTVGNDSGITGKVNLGAKVFNHSEVISSELTLSNAAVVGRTTLSRNDNWEKIVMRPYFSEGLESNEFWVFELPGSGLYLEENQDLTFIYSENGLNNIERMSLRIDQGETLRFLAHNDGTGSTLPVISAGEEIVSGGTLSPQSGEFNVNIPKISLETNYSERTLVMPSEGGEEKPIQIKNDSVLPLELSFGGYKLNESPADIGPDNFAVDIDDFNSANNQGNSKIFLEFLTEKVSGYVNFSDGNSRVLIPRESTPQAEDFSKVAILRGLFSEENSEINVLINGGFTQAMGRSVDGDFISTIYLRWSVREFAEFLN